MRISADALDRPTGRRSDCQTCSATGAPLLVAVEQLWSVITLFVRPSRQCSTNWAGNRHSSQEFSSASNCRCVGVCRKHECFRVPSAFPSSDFDIAATVPKAATPDRSSSPHAERRHDGAPRGVSSWLRKHFAVHARICAHVWSAAAQGYGETYHLPGSKHWRNDCRHEWGDVRPVTRNSVCAAFLPRQGSSNRRPFATGGRSASP